MAKDKNNVVEAHPNGCLCDDCKSKARAASGEPEPEYIFDPAASVSGTETSSTGEEYTQTKRRGRKPGKKAGKEAHSNLTNIILQSHVMLAALLDTEELMLNQQEAGNLADAVERVEQFYTQSVLGDEATAWLNLAIVCAITYGPRYMAYSKRKKRSQPIDLKKEPGGVYGAGTSEAVQ